MLLKYVGLNPVIVHGGGPRSPSTWNDWPSRSIDQGLRVSDEQTVEVAEIVLVGKLNKSIVLRLNRRGQAAVGLCGDDGTLFAWRSSWCRTTRAKSAVLGFVGKIEKVDVDVLNHIAEDYIPVVASVGADAQGRSYNVNADEAAAAVASALGAYKIIFLTDVEGWLKDPPTPPA